MEHLWLFGSYARGEAHERSDVDIIVRFQHDMGGYFVMGEIKDLLEQALGLEVDVQLDYAVPEHVLRERLLIF